MPWRHGREGSFDDPCHGDGGQVNYWIVKTEPSTYSSTDLPAPNPAVWAAAKYNLALKYVAPTEPG